MSDAQIKELADKAHATLAVINEKADALAKLDDVVDRDTFQKANAEFDKKYEAWEAKRAEAQKASDDRLDAFEVRLKKMLDGAVNEKTGKPLTEFEQRHLGAFNDFVRRGDAKGVQEVMADAPAELKRLTADDDGQAGYLVAPEFIDSEVSRIVSETSPIRQFASVVTIGSSTWRKNVNIGGTAATREDQDQDSSSENTNPSFREVRITPTGARCVQQVSPDMLEDGRVSMEQLLTAEMGIAFAELESPEFLTGAGGQEARGILSYTNTATGSYTGAWETVEYHVTGADGGFQAAGSGPEEVFIDTIHSLKAAYQPNARFFMTRATLGEVRKIKDGDNRPLFMWDGAMPATIAGEEYTIFQDMPAIATDSFSIMYADLRAAYQIVDRAGLQVMRDPYSQKPNVEFFGRKRFSGGAKMLEAVKLIKFGTS